MPVYPPGFEPLTPPVAPEISDRRLLDAIRAVEQGGPGREMGVLSVPAPDFLTQVQQSAQTVKNVEQRFANATGKSPTDDSGRYSPDFLRYFSQGGPGYPGYAAIGAPNDPRGLNAAHLKNLTAAYAEATRPREAARTAPMAQNDPAYPPGFEPLTPPVTLPPAGGAPAAPGLPPGFEALTPAVTLPPQGSAIGRAYEAAAGPAHEFFAGPANNLARLIGGLVTNPYGTIVERYNAPGPEQYRAPIQNKFGQAGAAVLNPVPENLTQLGATLGTLAAGPFGPAARIAGAGLGAAAGADLSGKGRVEQLMSGLFGAGTSGLLEGTGGLATRVAQRLPYVQGVIREGQAQEFKRAFGEANPATRQAVEAQTTAPALKGGRTAAQIDMAVQGGDVQRAASAQIQQHIDRINQIADNPTFAITGAIKQAWDRTDPLIKEQLTGQPITGAVTGTMGGGPLTRVTQFRAPDRLTLEQLQEVRSYISSQAFADSQQGLTPAAKQKLVEGVNARIESELPPQAVAIFKQANREYGGAQVMIDMINKQNSMQMPAGQMFLNRSAMSNYMRMNREEMRARLGGEAFDDLQNNYLGGAQPGAVDVLTPGGGRPESGALQVFGRGIGGTPSTISALGRIVLPGLGDVWMGRQPYQIPPLLQTIIDMTGQRPADQLRQNLRQPFGPRP